MPGSAGRLREEARTLAGELVREGHLDRAPRVVVTPHAAPHDLTLRIGPVPGSASTEAYCLEPDDGDAVITGGSAAGVLHGTRTLLQVLCHKDEFSGRITDWPTYDQRGLMVDVGRKHFTPGWLEGRIRELAWLKLNALHLHLSDGLGFRIESQSHPEVVTRPALTKDEVRHLVSVADRYHVTVIPEIDSPGHMEAALRAHPELQLVRADGTRDAGNLDYSKPAARRFMRDLVEEYAGLFPGPWFLLGGDEYFGYPWDANKITGENAPQLLDYARREAGPDATPIQSAGSALPWGSRTTKVKGGLAGRPKYEATGPLTRLQAVFSTSSSGQAEGMPGRVSEDPPPVSARLVLRLGRAQLQ